MSNGLQLLDAAVATRLSAGQHEGALISQARARASSRLGRADDLARLRQSNNSGLLFFNAVTKSQG